jgi:hypothetical protein
LNNLNIDWGDKNMLCGIRSWLYVGGTEIFKSKSQGFSLDFRPGKEEETLIGSVKSDGKFELRRDVRSAGDIKEM